MKNLSIYVHFSIYQILSNNSPLSSLQPFPQWEETTSVVIGVCLSICIVYLLFMVTSNLCLCTLQFREILNIYPYSLYLPCSEPNF